jgi:branched-chain amino acid transport system permease protein
MRADRLVTPVALLLVAVFVVALPAERSRDTMGTVSFLAGFATTVAMYGIITLGLNVQWGYTGVFNFGVAAFFMVGAYTAAIFAKPPADSEFVRYIGGFGDVLSPFGSDQWLPFLVATLAAGLASGLLAFLLSIPTLRLREDYLAIATIGVAELLRRVTIQEDGLVNSNRGLIGIPRPFYDYFDPVDYKYVYLAIAVLVLLLLYLAVERGIRSPWGRVLRALREDEHVVAASGKNVFAFKLQGFVLGAVIMGIGGAVFAYSRGSVGPDTFDHFFATFIFWAMLIVGGSGNNRGAIAGVFVVWGIWTIMLQLNGYDLPDVIQSRIFFIRDFLIGALIVIALLLRPQGLFPEERRVSIWLDREMRRQRREDAGREKARG